MVSAIQNSTSCQGSDLVQDVLLFIAKDARLCRQLNRAGYHRTYIGQLERGEKSPSLRTLFNVSATLGISPSVLIRRVERLV